MSLNDVCNSQSLNVISERKCLIPIQEFKNLSGLSAYDLIQISVRAVNEDCFGPFSPFNKNGAKIVACPLKMNKIKASPTKITKSSIDMTWEGSVG
jgi:hypothetical protein